MKRLGRACVARVVTVLLVTASGSILGCAYPEASTRGVDESPLIVLEGAPEGSQLVIDGINVGEAAEFSGEQGVAVLPGRHIVEIVADGRVLAQREVFVDAQGIKTLDFSSIGQ